MRKIRPMAVVAAFFISLAVFAAGPRPDLNLTCQGELDEGGYASIAQWLQSKVPTIEANGIPRAAVARLARLWEERYWHFGWRWEERYLSSLLSGRVTDLSDRAAQGFSCLFQNAADGKFCASVPESAAQEIERLLAIADRSRSLADRAHALYALNPVPSNPDEAVLALTSDFAKGARYFLNRVHKHTEEKNGKQVTYLVGDLKVGSRTYTCAGRETGEVYFTIYPSQISWEERHRAYVPKVYINLPFEDLKAALEDVLYFARMNGASEFKFLAVSKPDRSEKMIAYFTTLEDAVNFSRRVQHHLAGLGYRMAAVPFTMPISRDPKTCTSLAVDYDVNIGGPNGKDSWRRLVTWELAQASLYFPKSDYPSQTRRVQLVYRYLILVGIDPDHWLPLATFEQNRSLLDALSR